MLTPYAHMSLKFIMNFDFDPWVKCRLKSVDILLFGKSFESYHPTNLNRQHILLCKSKRKIIQYMLLVYNILLVSILFVSFCGFMYKIIIHLLFSRTPEVERIIVVSDIYIFFLKSYFCYFRLVYIILCFDYFPTIKINKLGKKQKTGKK